MASIRRHPDVGTWQVRYRDEKGRQRSRNFKKHDEAKTFSNAVETDKRRGEFVDPARGRTTFAEYAERWEAMRRKNARSTRDRDNSYLRCLILPTFGSLPVSRIRTSQVEEWVATLDRAPSTVNKALRIVYSVLELARRDDALKVNPVDGVRPPRVDRQPVGRALDEVELAAVFAAAEEVVGATAPMVRLMGQMGLRVGEAIALRRKDIDLETGTLTVAGTMSRSEGRRRPKGKAGARQLPMPTDVTERLRRHLKDRDIVSLEGLVFTNTRGGPISYTNWRQRTWRRIIQTAGVGDVRPHDLRHTTATNLVAKDGFGPAQLQKYLGHADPRFSLRVYTHLSADHLPTPSPIGRPQAV